MCWIKEFESLLLLLKMFIVNVCMHLWYFVQILAFPEKLHQYIDSISLRRRWAINVGTKFVCSNNHIANWTGVYHILPITNTKRNQTAGPASNKAQNPSNCILKDSSFGLGFGLNIFSTVIACHGDFFLSKIRVNSCCKEYACTLFQYILFKPF